MNTALILIAFMWCRILTHAFDADTLQLSLVRLNDLTLHSEILGITMIFDTWRISYTQQSQWRLKLGGTPWFGFTPYTFAPLLAQKSYPAKVCFQPKIHGGRKLAPIFRRWKSEPTFGTYVKRKRLRFSTLIRTLFYSEIDIRKNVRDRNNCCKYISSTFSFLFVWIFNYRNA